MTPAYVINRDYNKLKKKYGSAWVTKYFRAADKLFNENKIEIVEYRYAGVVTKDCAAYHFHAIAGFDLKSPWISFVIDITDQFNDCSQSPDV